MSAQKSYSIEYKLNLVNRVEEGESIHSISRSENVDRKRIREWVKKKDDYVSVEKKRKGSRLSGGGPGAKFPELEEKLIEWFRQQRDAKLQVTYRAIRAQAQALKSEAQISDDAFKISEGWIINFCKRHKISSRRITHRGQADNRNPLEIRNVANDFITSLPSLTNGYSADQIFNMDETPCYFDMTRDSTLHFKGHKNVDGTDTGHRKSRFTVVLAAGLNGSIMKALVIFKGLVRVPTSVKPTKQVALAVARVKKDGVWMWVDNTFGGRDQWEADMDPELWINFGLHAGIMVQQEQYAKFSSDMGTSVFFSRDLVTRFNGFCEYHNPDEQYCYIASTETKPYEGIGVVHTGVSSRECAIKCRVELICRALSYSQTRKQCVLLKPSYTNQFTLTDGFKFFIEKS